VAMTVISRTPVGDQVDWASFWASAQALTRWAPDKQVLFYLESVSKCVLDSSTVAEVAAAPVDAFEGRVFDDHVELRWRRTAAGFTGAVIREGGTGEPAVWSIREYYLLGLETKAPGVFREGRYPGKDFTYPIKSGDDKGRRAFITVTEYRRARPFWPTSEDRVEELLDQPLLFEHRFTGIGIR